MINFAASGNTGSTTASSVAVNGIVPPDDVPPAAVPARPKPAPSTSPAGVLVPA